MASTERRRVEMCISVRFSISESLFLRDAKILRHADLCHLPRAAMFLQGRLFGKILSFLPDSRSSSFAKAFFAGRTVSSCSHNLCTSVGGRH